jgi:hypothetical protein
MPQLVKEIDSSVLDQNTCAKNKQLFPIAIEKGELKLSSSLNALGYIEFDTLCALSSLEEKFVCAELLWLSRCTYHFIGKYNCKGDYMVHRVDIFSDLRSPFILQKYNQLECCSRYNLVILSSSSFVLKKHDKPQKGEHSWLLHTACPPTKFKPRTVYCQEWGMMRTYSLRIQTLIIRGARSYVCIMIKLRIGCYLILIFQMCLGTNDDYDDGV